MLCKIQVISPIAAVHFRNKVNSQQYRLLTVKYIVSIIHKETWPVSPTRPFSHGLLFDTDKLIRDWELGVKESKLNLEEKKIHIAHLNAVRVSLN